MNREELISAVSQTLLEVREILKKSGVEVPEMEEKEKEVPEMEEKEKEVPEMEEKEKDEKKEMPPKDETSMAEESPLKEKPEGEESAAEESMEHHAQQLSDEELEMMLSVLMAEKERRGALKAPAGEPKPEEKKMEESPELAKSIAEMAKAIQQLTTEVEGLKKSSATKKPVVSVKPAATGQATVLAKSEEPEKMLTKEETIDFLYNLQKSGNKMVNSSVIADVNACKSDEELVAVQKRLIKSGITLPKA